jgi:exonuclease III
VTLNVGRDLEHKIEQTLKYLTDQDIDIAILTESDEGASIQAECKDKGYMVFATEKEHAGVSILIKDQWADMITGTPNIIEDGRCISIKLQTPQNGNIIITGVYNNSGLYRLPNSDEATKAKDNMEHTIADIDEHTQLSIVAGDFNATSDPQDRQRPPNKDIDHIGNGEPLAPLVHSDHIDTHQHGAMTNFARVTEPDGSKWTSKARLDRIYVWSKQHARTIHTSTKRMPFKTTHNAILTAVMTHTAPIEIDKPHQTRRPG